MPEDAVTYLQRLLWFDRAGELRPGKQAEFDAAALVAAYARAANLFHRVGVPESGGHRAGEPDRLLPAGQPRAVPSTYSANSWGTLGLGDRADPETDRVVQAYHAVTLGHLISGGLASPS